MTLVNYLANDVLRSIAHWLNPRDRLNFALCNKRIYNEVWGESVREDLTNRFPVEHRLEFDLNTTFDAERCPRKPILSHHQGDAGAQVETGSLRIVPERSRSQHCHVSVSHDGRRILVLPYDNIMRLIDVCTKEVIAENIVDHVCAMELWDEARGKHVVTNEEACATSAYVEAHRIDAEIGFGFSSNSQQIFVSGKSLLKLYDIAPNTDAIIERCSFHVSAALDKMNEEMGIGGSCEMSPDGRRIAWVVFAGSPAQACVSVWDVNAGRCTATYRMAGIHAHGRSTLGWARVQYAPNGRYLIGIVNSAKRHAQVIHTTDGFQQRKTNEFVLVALDMTSCATSRNTAQSSSVSEGTSSRMRRTWIDMSLENFGRDIVNAISALISGLPLYDREPTLQGLAQVARKYPFKLPGLYLNSIHCCPSEATYKCMSLGTHSRHPWLVIKQPMYSIHIHASGTCGQLAASSHGNTVCGFARECRSIDTHGLSASSSRRAGNARLPHALSDNAITVTEQNEARLLLLEDIWSTSCPGITKRRFAFYGTPWKAGYATATAFASTGKWLASVTLLDDKCIVCIRNITLQEYFG